jgi:6-phosphofructokinase 2
MHIDSTAVFTGGGIMGDWLDGMLHDEGISTIPFYIQGLIRENFTVLEEASSQQYRFGVPGPELFSAEWKGILETVASLDPAPRFLVASGSLPPGVPSSFYARMSETARGRGTKFILDSSGPPLREALEAGVYLCKPNMKELQSLAAPRDGGRTDLVGLARKLLVHGSNTSMVISLGTAGALLVTSSKSLRISAPTVNIQSKVGAGDSMVAGIVAGLYREWSLEDAARYGVAAGAAAVMTPGTELCRKQDVEKLYRIIVNEKGSDTP